VPAPESILVETSQPGVRLDRYLADRHPDSSRGRFQQLLEQGLVLVNGKPAKGTHQPRAGDRIEIHWPEPVAMELKAQDIPLEVLYEDDDLLVLNKSADLVVHPSAGHEDGTLVNALLHHCQGRLSGIGGVERPGIVHRLDLGTSGCLVVAKSDAAHIHLSAQFAGREVDKRYHAVAIGTVHPQQGDIRAPIARHPVQRKKMAVSAPGDGREAWTGYRLLESFPNASLVECRLHTGRTHQIRVHLAHLGFPLLGDDVYGERANRRFRQELEPSIAVPRQMLHAVRLEFTHPRTRDRVSFEAPHPADFTKVLGELREG
jgi:23S rRNA pseudouridine1911/1915/1917 synthase